MIKLHLNDHTNTRNILKLSFKASVKNTTVPVLFWRPHKCTVCTVLNCLLTQLPYNGRFHRSNTWQTWGSSWAGSREVRGPSGRSLWRPAPAPRVKGTPGPHTRVRLDLCTRRALCSLCGTPHLSGRV